MSDPPLLRPEPRRTFHLTPVSTDSSAPPTPTRDSSDLSRPDLDSNGVGQTNRTRSILNLTSSTLFGIYSPTASSHDGTREEPSTPFGTGSQTPILRTNLNNFKPPITGAFERPRVQRSQSHHHSSFGAYFLPLVLRSTLLFLFGVAYGLLITQLHDTQQLAPVKIEGIDLSSWRYLVLWGMGGVVLGGLLPWVDILWEDALGDDEEPAVLKAQPEESRNSSSEDDERSAPGFGSGLGTDWNPVVRSIGAFVGIAFAIRKLPWQSTLQVSLTLALVNPVLWYLVDRSKPGFLLSALVGITGTAVLLGVNPDMVPPPAAPSPHASMANASYQGIAYDGFISNESIGVGTWIASVLFCSCVCFGNIGRRLALGNSWRRGSIS